MRRLFGSLRATLAGLALGAGVCVAPAAAQTAEPVLATSRIIITGGGITIAPAHHVVPRNIATAVETTIAIPGGNGGDGANIAPAFPSDAVMTAELVGPSLGATVVLTTRPGEAFRIQPLAIAGLHFLRNIRLVSGGTTLLAAVPDAVTIEVIDRVLVSQVTSRPLTADEIRDRGIVVDQSNYQVMSFSAAFGFQDRKVTIDFPMVVPARSDAALAPAAPPLELPRLAPASMPIPSVDLPKLVEAFQTPNVSVGGLLLRVEDEEIERAFSVPPLSGVIVIPGNIAYLNQFFSILTLVSNAAPGHSNLTAHDVRAEILLPPGTDTVAGSGDDPLRMARLGSPPAEQSRILPVTLAGPDGKFGTSDDILFIAPQRSGNSEHLVEGLREGIHTIEIKITAMLHGLPIGPVPISGRVLGTVEVRNPTFALTLSHPATVTAGEEYDLLVTLTNTSRSPANLASVNLLPRSISGAVLLSDQTVQIETIAPGDSETVSFRLLSQTTGTVTATSFTSEGIPGRFELRSAVGAHGIAMSPNTLVLPPAADALPAALRSAGIRFLGQAFALATSPVLPEGLLPLRQQIVYDRATLLSLAGQRLELREPLPAVLRDLLLDWSGNDYVRLAERFPSGQEAQRARTQEDYRGFDDLLRRSRRGHDFSGAAGAALASEIGAVGAAAFMETWARESVWRAPHIAALATPSHAGTALALQITDPASRLLGTASPGAAVVRSIPYGAFVPTGTGRLALIATPQAGAHEVAVSIGADGTFDLALVVPEGATLRRVAYTSVSLSSSARARVRFSVGAANAYLLEIDDTADSVPDRSIEPSVSETVADVGPRLVSAVQIVTGRNDLSRWGQLIGLVFSEEVSRPSVQERVAAGAITNYSVEANQVLGASLQPGGRVVLLSLRDGVGPLVPRTVTVTGIEDPRGHPMEPSPATALIVPTIEAAGGRISGRVLTATGTAVPGARVRLLHQVFEGEVTLSVKDAGPDGRFTFDYVPVGGTHIEASDPESGERGSLRTILRTHAQHLELDVVLLGTGTVAGVARSPAGVPLSGAVVRARSLTRMGDVFSAVTNATGAYVLNGVPVGNFTLEAAHTRTNARTLIAAAVPTPGAVVVQDLTLIPLVEAAVQTGSVAGQVFRQDGTPAAGIPVFTNRGGLVTTDASGAFRIDLLPAGEVTIRAIDQARFEQGTVTTTVTAGATQQARLLIFGGTGTIRGVVLNADGQPVAGAQVGGGPSLAATNAAGEFELTGVPLGSRTLSALDPATGSTGQSSVNLNAAGETAHAQIVLQARGSIAGRVFDAHGAPVAQLRVYLIGGTNLATLTDANGGYRFENIVIGSYQISAFLPDLSDGNIVSTRLSFRGEVRTVNVRFRGKGRVTGRVLNAAGTTPLGATVGLSELRVRAGVLRDPANANCLPDVQVGDVKVDLPDCVTIGIGFRFEPITRIIDNDVESGTFTFDDVFVGSVTVEAASALSPTVVSARGTIDAPGNVVDLELRLTATSVVTGTVFMPDGAPAGADVVVTLDGRNVVTDAQGRFTHFEVPAGAFTLTASDPDTGFLAQARGSVGAGTTADVPIRLLGTGTVHVEVRGAAGPVAGARVRLRAGSYPHETREAHTDATGRVLFAGGDAITEGPVSASAFDAASGVTGFASGTVAHLAQTELVVQLPNEAGIVEGRFLTVADTPVTNAQIKLSSAGGEAFATTLADGSFRFEGVRRGNLTVEAFDPVTARRGRSTGRISAHGEVVTIDVRQVPQGSVRGAVRLSTDSSAVPSADITVSVNSVFDGQFRTTSALDGTFMVPGISAGTFTVSASDSTTGLSGSASGSLTAEGEVAEVEIILHVPARGRVQGHVTAATGAPAAGAQVSLGSRNTTADDAGFYFFDNVSLGSVSVLAVPLLGPDSGRAAGSLVFAGEVLTLNVQLIGTGSVSGTVRSGGELIPFAAVGLTSRTSTGRGFSATTQTNSQGAFAFPSVPVGDVSVTAVQSVTGLGGSRSATIDAHGAHLELEVTLEPSAALRARILREGSAAPAVGMAVELTGTSRRYGTTVADGTLRFTDLALGTYQLLVSDPTGEGIARATAVLDEAGEELDLADLVLDESAPSVAGIIPSDGATQVPVTQGIIVTFSERVKPTTVTTSTMRVSTPAGPLAGAWSLMTDGRTATFAPTAPFADFSQVNVKITTGVRDLVDRSLAEEVVAGFQTADSVPPAFVSFSPAADATGVAPDAVIRVGYSEAVNPAAFLGPAMEVRRGGVLVDGQISAILSNTVLVFTPSTPLQPNSAYSVTVRPATDVFGNVQPVGAAFAFATIDTMPPVIGQLTADRTSAVEGSIVTVTADLGSTPDVASVEFMVNGTVVKTDTQAPFDAAIAASGALRPSFTVSARATDRSGNISSPASLTITVEFDAPPTVAILAPAPGAVVDSGASFTLRVRGTDDRGVARLSYQTSGQLTTSGAFTVNPPDVAREANFTILVPASTGPGPLTLRAAATDVAGASSPTVSVAVTVADASPPAVQIVSPGAGQEVRAGATATILVSAADNGTIASVTLETTGAATFSESRTVTPGATAQASFDIPIPNDPAVTSLNVTVRARDAAGNESGAIARTFAVFVPDTRRPEVSSVVTASGAVRVLAGEAALLRATISDNVGVAALRFSTEGAFTVSGTVTVAPPLTSGTVGLTLQVPSDAPNGGVVTVHVRAVDAADNESEPASLTLTIGDAAPPVLTVLGPPDGTEVAPGQTITIQARATDDTALRRVILNASGVFALSETREVDPSAAAADVTFTVTVPAQTAAGTLELRLEAVDVAGNSSGLQRRSVIVRDVVAPGVTITSPVAGASVDPREPVAVSVEASDAVGVTQVSFSASGAAAGTDTRAIDPASASTVQNFAVAFASPPAAGGVLTLNASARDAAGNVGVAAAVVLQVLDVVPPTVAAVAPSDTATGVDPQTIVTIQFSEGMEPATLTSASVSLSRDGGPEPVTVAVSGDGRVVTLTPTARPLPFNTLFTVTVAESVTDRAGNALGARFTSTFRTISPDTTPPAVQATNPIGGAADVSFTVPIDVAFTEAIEPATVTDESFRVTVGGAVLAGSRAFMNGNATVRFRAAEPLPAGAVVDVALSTAITDPAGNPLAAPHTFSFTTGTFGITNPPDGADVPELSTLLLEARASATLGVASVVFTVNGQALPADTSPPFVQAFTVPSAASTPTLIITASARNASGVQIAADARTANVVVGLTVSPPLLGVPRDGTARLRFAVSTPLPEDLSIALSAGDPTLVNFPANPVVLRAGERFVDAAVAGAALGNTAVFGDSARGTAIAIVSVSEQAAGQTLMPLADPVGASLSNPAISTTLAADPAETVGVSMQVLSSPAPAGGADVVVTSTNPAVATATSAGRVGAGAQTASLSITTGEAGVAMLIVRAGTEVRGVLVIVGTPAAQTLPLTSAPMVGFSMLNPPVAGQLITSAGAAAVITVPVLPTAAAGDTLVTVDSSNPSVATGTAASVPAGALVSTITIEAHADGVATLTIRAGTEVRAFMVVVGNVPAANRPIVFATPVGVNVIPPVRAGDVFAPAGAARTVSIRVLASPAAVDTPVTVATTDETVVSVAANPVIPAGQQVLEVTLTTGAGGRARITIDVNGTRFALDIVVGAAPGADSPVVTSPPVGVSVVPPPSAGMIIAPANVPSAPTLLVPLLTAPAAAPVQVTARSSNASIAAFGGSDSTTLTIFTGEQAVTLPLAIPGATGAALLSFDFEGERRELLVVVGNPPPSQVPVITAPVVGVAVSQ